MPHFSETQLHSERCLLRPWRDTDAPRLTLIANTKAISWNTSYNFPYPFDLTAAHHAITANTTNAGTNIWQFAILQQDTIIGGCGATRGTDVQSHTATIGYWLGQDYWGQGIATEVLAVIVTYMQESTDIEQLTATGYGWNPASERVLSKNGFVKEGLRKGAVKKWGKTTDLWIYGRLLGASKATSSTAPQAATLASY
ncbi:GNAT family N-acetyltransferase [Pseudodesulfovibrio sp. JC047]|uniref:GNAT family N-acetyltransferase n=1 Tax=Pseudodesulfovibrio sp. JC047 TaxID=2683199 RepID=UPI0013D33E21|nr:GNAT family protein [Pseudodesulfovibrio sp. JC047]NDV20729.1 GNAT family N-acetyltransferase [Pseudodesulfovibrio sp. JC047]